jgi:hypothetical protein
MALGMLPLGLLVSLRLPCATPLFTAPTTLLARRSAATRAAGLVVAAAPLSVTTGFLLRLRLGRLPRPLRLTALLPTACALLFGTFSALLFATTGAVRPFVAPAPLFRAFGALMGMTSPAPLSAGFRVGAGERDVRQGKRTADGDRAALSASVS